MRFLPIVTQIFLWGAIFQNPSALSGETTISGYTYQDMIAYYLLTHDQPAFSSMPGLAGGIARQIRSRRSQEVSDSAGRHDRVFAAQPGGAQAGLLHGGGRPLCAWCSFFCRRTSPGWPEPIVIAGFSGLAGDGILAGIFSGSPDGNDRVLVFGSQLAVVRVHAVYVFLFGTHVPDRHVAGRLEDGGRRHAAAISGLFSGRGVSGQDRGPALVFGLAVELGWVVLLAVACRMRLAARRRAYSGVWRLNRAPIDNQRTFRHHRRLRPRLQPALALDVSARVRHVRPQQPGAGHDVSLELRHRVVSSLSWMLMNLGFYVLIFRFTTRSARHGLGQISSSLSFCRRRCSSTAWCRRFSCPTPKSSANWSGPAGSTSRCSSRSIRSF